MKDDETKRLYYLTVRCTGYVRNGAVTHAPDCPLKWLKGYDKPLPSGTMESHGLSEVCDRAMRDLYKMRPRKVL